MFLIPVIAFVLISILAYTFIKSTRSALLAAAVVWGLLIVAITEFLNLFHIITFGWLLTSWILVIFAVSILLIYKWCVANADFLFDDDEHKQNTCLAFDALIHLNFPLLVIIFPAITLFFQNAVELLGERFKVQSLKFKELISQLPNFSTFQSQNFITLLQRTLSVMLIAGVIAIVIATGIIAFASPPNNYDSMYNHMAKIPYWVQNQSIEPFSTHSIMFIRYEPFAGFSILQFQILSGGDRFANCIQWFSMIGCLIGVSLIAKKLGAKVKGQILTIVLCATIPMGIMQSTSTQVDYVTSFWFVCFVYYFLLALSKATWPIILALGSSFALALLTKTTNYFFILPFAVWLVMALFRQMKLKAFAPLLAIAGIVLLVNLPHYSRNINAFKHPLGLITRSNIKKITSLTIGGWDAKSTNLKLDESTYGSRRTPLLINNKKYPNYVAFDIFVEEEGQYELYVGYATDETSPFDVYVNEYKKLENVGSEITGGYYLRNARRVFLGTLWLSKGKNVIKLQRDKGTLPHIIGIMINAPDVRGPQLETRDPRFVSRNTLFDPSIHGSQALVLHGIRKVHISRIANRGSQTLPSLRTLSHSLLSLLANFSPSSAYAAQPSSKQFASEENLFFWSDEDEWFDESTDMELEVPWFIKIINKELGVDKYSKFSLPWIISSLSKNIAMQLATSDTESNGEIFKVVEEIHKVLGIDVNELPSGKRVSQGRRFAVRQMLDEDIAVNPDHFLLFAVCLGLMLFSKKVRKIKTLKRLAFCIIIGFVLLSIWFGWSPYNSRRMLPLFVISSPVIAVALCNFVRFPFILELLAAAMLWFSFPWVVGNAIRPLIGTQTVFNTPQYDQYFIKFGHLQVPYKAIASFLKTNKIASVGFYGKRHFVDYPLLVALQEDGENRINVKHIGVKNVTRKVNSNSENKGDPEIIVSWDAAVTSIYTETTYYSSIWSDGNLVVLAKDSRYQHSQDKKSESENRIVSSTRQHIDLLASSMKQCYAQADAQLLKNGRFFDSIKNWNYWQLGKTYPNSIKINNGVLKIQNPYKKLIGVQQRVNVVSGAVYRLSGVARSVATTQADMIFGGRISFYLPPQKEQQLVWMSEYNQWSQKELVFTNKVTGTATILVHLGYGGVGTTGEFTNVRLEKF